VLADSCHTCNHIYYDEEATSSLHHTTLNSYP
jgi:hypothetical protein